jgi:NAD+ kinase
MVPLRIACVHSGSETAERGFQELSHVYSFVPPEECDVILALGGDGLMLHTLHQHLSLGRPIFGMNCGTLGFLLNSYASDGLARRIETAQEFELHPLRMKAVTRSGETSGFLAFNEVTVLRHTGQSANLRIQVDGVERLAKFVGDGIILATPAGSTAYNFSAHGPIVPLGSSILALTPVSPFRPRRWRGALLPHNAEVLIENLDPEKRPLSATADFQELFEVVSVSVQEEPSHSAKILFDRDHPLQERVLREQFVE